MSVEQLAETIQEEETTMDTTEQKQTQQRRNRRRRPLNTRRQNTTAATKETTEDAAEETIEGKTTTTTTRRNRPSGASRRRVRRGATRTTTEENEGEETVSPRVPMLSVDDPEAGTDLPEDRLNVSNLRSRLFYAKVARRMFGGLGLRRATSSKGSPLDKIEIAALGNAITQAVIVADRLQKDGVCTLEKMSCDNIEMTSSTDSRTRRVPQIILTLTRNAEWDINTDTLIANSTFLTGVKETEETTETEAKVDITETTTEDRAVVTGA